MVSLLLLVLMLMLMLLWMRYPSCFFLSDGFCVGCGRENACACCNRGRREGGRTFVARLNYVGQVLFGACCDSLESRQQ